MSTVAFGLTVAFAYLGSDIATGIGWIILMVAACRDSMRVCYFYTAIVLHLLGALGSFLTIFFVDDLYDDDECENEDGSEKTNGWCPDYKYQIYLVITMLFCLLAAGLIWWFLYTGRYEDAFGFAVRDDDNENNDDDAADNEDAAAPAAKDSNNNGLKGDGDVESPACAIEDEDEQEEVDPESA